MTTLNNTLTRLVHTAKHGSFVVELNAGGTITFRRPKTKQRYTVHLAAAFYLAVIDEGSRIDAQRMEEYKRKKAAGYKRLRKPKPMKVADFYSTRYLKALKAV